MEEKLNSVSSMSHKTPNGHEGDRFRSFGSHIRKVQVKIDKNGFSHV